ncbi:MAG: asparaginase domain-containing protein [Rhodothermales bacterium]
MRVKIYTTGGTIDKTYFDAKSEYEVGDPQIVDILRIANVGIDYDVETVLRKDSLDMTDEDRGLLVRRVQDEPCERILITHGTDTMIDTARELEGVVGKTIVLVGSLSPAQFKNSDAEFNIGFALAAVQVLPAGIYIAMNGIIFEPEKVRKNRERNRFESA